MQVDSGVGGRFSGFRSQARPSSRRAMPFGLIPVVYAALGAFAATGGARPTGIGAVDAAVLALAAVGLAACARRSRSVPVYIAGGTAAALQPDVVPMVVGVLSIVAAASLQFSPIRRYTERRAVAAAAAGGLAWCAFAGAPNGRVADVWVVPLVAFVWVVISARRNGGVAFRRRWKYLVAITAGLAFAFAALGALALMMARADVNRGTDRLDDGLAAARSGDTEAAKDQLQRGAAALSRADDALGALWARPALLVPGVSQHVRGLGTAVSAASEVADVAAATADEVDLERFGASAGRIDPAAIAEVADPLAELLAALDRARGRISQLDDTWLLATVRDQVDDADAKLVDATESARLALSGVKVVPEMIGLNGPRTYLVLFTTPVEARAMTGFPGNYAEIRFEDGRFEMTEFGRVSELSQALPEGGADIDLEEDYERRYGRFGVTRDWRNITMSPDFPTVADVARQLYAAGGKGEVDGVLSVSPQALASLLTFTGPINVSEAGITLNSDNAAEYLLREQYLEYDTDNDERRDVLEFLAEDAFARLASVDLPGPKGLRTTLGPTVERRDLQFYAFEPAEAAFLEKVGIDGGFEATADDFLAVTTTNAAGNKIDLFMEQSIAYDVAWDSDSGQVDATATVTFRNTAPSSGLPRYLIGNALGNRPFDIELPEGSNYSFVTIYSPWLLKGASLDGESTTLESMQEFGVHAYALYLPLAPGETRTLTVELTGGIDDFRYELAVIPQPALATTSFSFTLQATGGGQLAVALHFGSSELDTAVEGAKAQVSGVISSEVQLEARMSGA